MKQAELLERFPQAGRPAEDLEPEHRELLIPFGGAGYVLLYHFAESGGRYNCFGNQASKGSGILIIELPLLGATRMQMSSHGMIPPSAETPAKSDS